MRISRWWAVAAGVMLLVSPVAFAQPQRVVVGGGQFKPMFFLDEQGKPAGRDIELWRLWSEKTGVPVEFQFMDWADAIPALLGGDIDVVDGASFTPERAEYLAFTEPYQELHAYAFFHDNSAPVNALADLADRSVGVLAGSNVEDYLQQVIPEAHLVPFSDYSSLVADALAGRLSVFVAEDPMISYHFSLSGGAGGFRRSSAPFVGAELRMAVRHDDSALLELVNEGFDRITKPERRRIDENWFGVGLGNEGRENTAVWFFLFLAVVVAISMVMILARTWYRELPNMQVVRDRFVNMWLLCAAIAGPALALQSAARAFQFGWHPIFTLHGGLAALLMLAAIFRKRINQHVRALLILGGLFALGFTGLLTYGIVGTVILPLAVLVVTSVILYGVRGGTLAILASLVAIGGVGFAVQMGFLTYNYDIEAYAWSVGAWTLAFTNFAFYTFAMGLGTAGVYRHMERALAKQRESEARFRTLVENIPGVNYRCASDQHWTMEFVSNEIEALSGYPPSDFIGNRVRSFASIIHPADRDTVQEAVQRAIRDKEPFAFEYRIVHTDGDIRWVFERGQGVFDDAGRLTCLDGVMVDVTDRKQAEERMQLALKGADLGTWDWNVQTGETVYNERCVEMLGYTLDELEPHINTMLELLHSEDLLEVRKAWQEHLEGKTEVYENEHRLRHKDGHWVWVLDRGRVMEYDAEGKPLRLSGTHLDVTERRRLEEQLRQAQKMEALGQLAGGVAHDFNNLLQAITGYAELAQRDLGEEHRAQRSVDQIIKAGERARALIGQMLSFSRRQVLSPVDLNLNEVVDGVTKMIRRIIGEHIELECIPGYVLGTIHADRGQMEQVLLNLCVNARDAMPNGGKLTIETENVLVDSGYVETHPWSKPGRYVLLSVTDTGCGMAQSELEHIFEPFYTTKEVGQGTGLGLATVYGIVKQHEGYIHVYSEVGKGTMFKVYLPSVARNAAEVARSSPGVVKGGAETILVAEDDQAILRLVTEVLTRAGYTVLSAADGEEAVQVFKQHADTVDLALFDVVMPRLGGEEAMKRVLEIRPGLPHVFASGYSENGVHTGFIRKQGLHLIQKPYHHDALLRTIREALEG